MLTASEFIVIVLLAGVFMLLCSAFISYVLYRRKVLRLWTNYLMERSFWFFNIENRYVQGDLADDTMTGYFRVEWCFSYQDKFFKKGIHAFSVRNWDGEDLNFATMEECRRLKRSVIKENIIFIMKAHTL